MKKILKILKYIFLSLAVLLNGFIFYQAALPSDKSSAWSNTISDIYEKIINDGFKVKEKVVEIKPTNLTLKLSSYSYNKIDGYSDNQIPLGCVKKLTSSILPSDTSNKSVSFTCSDTSVANLVQSGNEVAVEALKTGNVTISCFSKVDNSITDTYDFEVINLTEPKDFSLTDESLSIPLNKSKYINVNILNEKLKNDPLLTCRYYDVRKLTYHSDDESIAKVDSNGFIKACGLGETNIVVSNSSGVSKTILVNVEDNKDSIVAPTSLSITGDNKVYILDVDYDRSEPHNNHTQLSVTWQDNIVPTDDNVIWSVDNPLAAIIDQNGVVRGYRKLSNENITFTVTATSVMDNSIQNSFEMTLCHVLPNALNVTLPSSIMENGVPTLIVGKQYSFTVTYAPGNVSKVGANVVSSDNDIATAIMNGNSLSIIANEEGVVEITLTSIFDDSVNKTIKFSTYRRPYVNNDTRDTFRYNIRKYFAGHAFLFVLNAIFVTLYIYLAHYEKKNGIRIISFISSLIPGFIFSALEEFIQSFAPGRSALFEDVMINFSGYGIGFALTFLLLATIYLIKFIVNKIKKNKSRH